MRKILTLGLLALTIIAQPAMAQNDKKAKSILDASNKKISNLKSLKSNFKLELIGSGVEEKKNGTFYMKGPKYRIEMDNKELIIISDNKSVWTYMKATNEAQQTEYNAEEQAISPAKLLTNFYDKEYNYKYVGLRKIDGQEADVVELTPKASGKEFTKVQIAVSKKTKSIIGGQVWEKNGNTYRYSLNGYTPNAKLDDSKFSFTEKEFPGVDVIDLR